MTGFVRIFDESPPIFVDGIGPPLQQIEQDWRELHDSTVGGITNDGLALLAEIKRLRDGLERMRDWPKLGEHRQVLSISHGLLADYVEDILESK